MVAAANGHLEVLMDGGVRRGSDIVKAVCMGEKAVLVGRSHAYGVAAAGYPGVVRALEILKADFERTMRLLGCGGSLTADMLIVQTTKPPGAKSIPHRGCLEGY